MLWLESMRKGRAECEEYSRARTMAYVDGGKLWCRVLGQYKVRGDRRNLDVMPCLAFDGFWEMWLTRMLTGFIKPGFTCIDVGANVGYFSLVMADLAGPGGRVFAYEPQPETFDDLATNVFANGFTDRVSCERLAVGAEGGEATLYSSPRINGGSTVGVPLPPEYEQEQTRVPVIRLDDQHRDRVDFLKVDAEGMDADVVRGAEGLFRKNPALVAVIESDPAHRDRLAPVLDWANADVGLIFWLVDPDGSVRRAARSEILDAPFCNVVLARG